MLRYATETYYQNKIERLERRIERVKAKLKELNLPEDVIKEFADDELF
jgi:prefoldin subunit 5